ncbi:MAG: DEAD/DEAH box helicase [Verrucomicrobiota bacterium]
MSWTESTLRGAASWQAFKAGQSLCAAGAASVAKSEPGGWQGSVRDGRQQWRVRVRVISPTAIETRCSCPENQASGAVCAHAVAVALAALRDSPAVTNQPPPSRAVPSPVPLAWDVLLAPNWRDALLRGRLAATLCLSAAPMPADPALSAWLAAAGGSAKSPLHLQLDGVALAGFLEALTGHPRIFVGKDRHPLEIRAAGAFSLREIIHQPSTLRLIPQAEPIQRVILSGHCWHLAPDVLTHIGPGLIPPGLAAPLAELMAGHSVDLPTVSFLATLEIWQQWLAFPPDSWLDALHFVAAPFVVGLDLDGSLQHLDARLTIFYSGSPPVPPGQSSLPAFPRLTDDHHCEVRDLESENRAASMLARAGFLPADPASGLWILRGESAIVHFLTHSLPGLQRSWTVSQRNRFHNAQRQIVLVEPKIHVIASGQDWLDFNLSFQTSAGEVIPAADIRRLIASGKNPGANPNARRLVVSSELSDLIDPLFAELDVHQQGGHFTASARSAELIHQLRNKLDKSLTSNPKDEIFEEPQPASIRANLRPYQSHGSGWLWDRVERFGGALLADDMGLGKTIQSIVLIERLFERLASATVARSSSPVPTLAGSGPDGVASDPVVLVVATTSLLGNWRAEMTRFAPDRLVRILHGSGRDSEREKVRGGEVVLTSYATLARDLAWHLRRVYALVVVDEASLMRNPDTDHAKALAKLRAVRRVALTGTPVENGVRDLWSIFRFILPGWLGTRQEFREHYELPLVSGEPMPALLERLRLKTAPFMLRRTKEQVAPELPSKLIIDEFCDLSPEQQSVYRELLVAGRKQVEAIQDAGQSGAARMRLLTALLRLRQTCCDLALLGDDRFKRLLVPQRSAKLQRLMELLDEARFGNHKVLVFSQFQTQLQEIENCLLERGQTSLRLDGQTRNRQELVDCFQSTGGPPVFLISLKAGGYGLNLTAADTVIHFDPWWNPAAETQASDRAHRIGQTRPVTVYRLLTRGTVEEKVLRLQAKKRSLAAAIDEVGLSEDSGLSEADLRAILDEAAPRSALSI